MKEDFNIEKINKELRRVYGISNRSVINTVLKEAGAYDLLKRSNELLDSVLSIHQYNKDVCTVRDIERIERMQESINKATK